MPTELKDLMDQAVAGVALPPHLAQQVADRYERGRRRRRGTAAFLTVLLVVAGGVTVWQVASATHRSGISSITPAPSSPDPSNRPSPTAAATSKIRPPLAPPATVTVVSTHESFPNGDASLDPPARGQTPTDLTEAWNRIAATLPGNPCDETKPETVQFGLFSLYRDTNPVVPEAAYDKTPEWILRCIDNPARPAAGPVYLPGQSHPTPNAQSTPVLEDFISVFDARTGKLLLGWSESAS